MGNLKLYSANQCPSNTRHDDDEWLLNPETYSQLFGFNQEFRQEIEKFHIGSVYLKLVGEDFSQRSKRILC